LPSKDLLNALKRLVKKHLPSKGPSKPFKRHSKTLKGIEYLSKALKNFRRPSKALSQALTRLL
jgi:hypothetical protein